MSILENVYNIIWVDDEVDSLSQTSKNLFHRAGIKVIAAVHTATEFREKMELLYDRVDAVITDANFNKGKEAPSSERDVSGLEDIRICIEKYNMKRDIPFYLYTGRKDLLDSKYEDGELEYFEKNRRFFQKGYLPNLVERIKQDVDHIQSPSYRIRKKYARELEAARRIEGNEEFLFDALVKEESGELDNVENAFNSVRKLVERIVAQCKKLKILPDIPELNKVCDFLRHKKGVYQLKEEVEIMPIPLIQSMKYLLDITQDGSHDGDANLKLRVTEYVRQTGNLNLFRSLLFIAMDLCLWFDAYSQEHPDDERNALDWELVKDYEGTIVEFDGHWLCKNYELEKPKDGKYAIGDRICITGSIDHKYPFGYTLGEESIHVDKYAHANKIHVNK